MQDIVDAIYGCDVETVTNLLDVGCDPNSTTDDQQTLLHCACNVGCLEIVELLLQRGADANALDEDNETPLHKATEAGHDAIALALLANGADPNVFGQWSGTALHNAVAKGHIEMVRDLLAHGADINAISEDGESGTPFHYAVSPEMVEYLLRHGADINAQDSYGHTALHDAAKNNKIAVAEALIEHGAGIEARSHSGWTALHWAVWEGSIGMVKLLLSSGADPNARVVAASVTTGWTPVCWSKTGPLKDAGEKRMRQGWTPLHLAAIQGHVEIAEYLIKKRAKVDAAVDIGGTPLDWAETMGQSKVAKILAQHSRKA